MPLRIWTGSFNIACVHDPFAAAAAAAGPGGDSPGLTAAAAADAAFGAFVPPGFDVYVLGVQEGQGTGFLEALSGYLGRSCGAVQLPCRARVEGRGDGSLVASKYTGICAWARMEHVVAPAALVGWPWRAAVSDAQVPLRRRRGRCASWPRRRTASRETSRTASATPLRES